MFQNIGNISLPKPMSSSDSSSDSSFFSSFFSSSLGASAAAVPPPAAPAVVAATPDPTLPISAPMSFPKASQEQTAVLYSSTVDTIIPCKARANRLGHTGSTLTLAVLINVVILSAYEGPKLDHTAALFSPSYRHFDVIIIQDERAINTG